jgi:hypothetical protein
MYRTVVGLKRFEANVIKTRHRQNGIVEREILFYLIVSYSAYEEL